MDKLGAVTRFATPETDREWAEQAQRLSAHALDLHARRAQGCALEEAEEAHDMRYLRSRKTRGGRMTNLYASLPTEDAAGVLQTLTRQADRQPKSPETGEWDRYEQRMADALVNLAATTIAHDPDPDRATVVIHISEDKLFGDTELGAVEEAQDTAPAGAGTGFADLGFPGPGFAELEDGTQIAIDTAKRLMCDGRIEFAIRTVDGNTIGIGRASRRVPAWLERQVVQRDKHCQVPGCETRYLLHCHHLIPWEELGPTNLNNLAAVCPYHHRWLHKTIYRLVRNPDGTHSLIKPDRGSMFRGPPPLRTEIRRRILALVGAEQSCDATRSA